MLKWFTVIVAEVVVDQDVRRFREVLQRDHRGRSRPHSKAVQEQALAYWHRRQAEGEWVALVAGELGLRSRTLARWVQRPTRPASFRRVTLVETPQARREALVVITPTGFRIEGLDLAQIAPLLAVLR